MKLRHQSAARLVLSGIPGGSAAIVVPIGLALVGGLALLFWYATGTIVPLVVGGVLLLVAVAAAVLAWTARESLTIDLSVRRARYTRRSLVRFERADFEFDSGAVHSVSIERDTIRAPGRRGGDSTQVWRARLRLTKPRRAIVLTETQGGTEHSIRPIAQAVADALEIALVDESGDIPETRRGRAIGAPIARSSDLGDLHFGPPPPGSRVRLDICTEREHVSLEWKTVGGPALPVLGLLTVGFFGVIATAMTLQALSIPVLSWLFGSPSAAPRPTPPAITVALVAMCIAVWLVWLLILELWLASHRRLTIERDCITLWRISPSARLLGAMRGGMPPERWSACTDDVRSIRTHDDAVEIRTSAATHRAIIHIPAEGEAAWIARVARASVRALCGAQTDAPE